MPFFLALNIFGIYYVYTKHMQPLKSTSKHFKAARHVKYHVFFYTLKGTVYIVNRV